MIYTTECSPEKLEATVRRLQEERNDAKRRRRNFRRRLQSAVRADETGLVQFVEAETDPSSACGLWGIPHLFMDESHVLAVTNKSLSQFVTGMMAGRRKPLPVAIDYDCGTMLRFYVVYPNNPPRDSDVSELTTGDIEHTLGL